MNLARKCLSGLGNGLAALALTATPLLAAGSEGGGGEPSPGEYVARAGACMSCHLEDLSGGYVIKSPMGNIVATNISPSVTYGIGDYTFEDFDRAMREGRTPEHYLYPAMPYAAYRGMTEPDMLALYNWIMEQPPVDKPPEKETDLPFPFNIRLAMIGWKAVALDNMNRVAAQEDPLLARGAYIVDHLGHCGECHTPRTQFFGLDQDQYLSGNKLDGWLAPNITGDELSGSAAWPREALVQYLKTGYAMDVAQAAGSMEKMVQHATSHLKVEDLNAVAAYLQSTPPIRDAAQTRPMFPPADEIPKVDHQFNEIREELAVALASDDLTGVERGYVVGCAACHGVDGEGQSEAYYPPLINNVSARRDDPTNLIRVLVEGSPAGGLYRTPGMPAFGDKLSDEGIAEMANFVRVTFGGHETSDLSAEDVALVMEGPKPPLLMRIAPALAWIAIILGVLLVAYIIWRLTRRRKVTRRHEP